MLQPAYAVVDYNGLHLYSWAASPELLCSFAVSLDAERVLTHPDKRRRYLAQHQKPHTQMHGGQLHQMDQQRQPNSQAKSYSVQWQKKVDRFKMTYLRQAPEETVTLRFKYLDSG